MQGYVVFILFIDKSIHIKKEIGKQIIEFKLFSQYNDDEYGTQTDYGYS